MILQEFNRAIDLNDGILNNVNVVDSYLELIKEEHQGSIQITEDFDTDTLHFDFTGDWIKVTTSPHTGQYCYRNKDIGNSQTSQTQVTVTLTQDGYISFWYRVSSEYGYDRFWFYIDGVEKLGGKSGTIGWTQVTYPLTAGQHTFIWRYTKDSSVSSGEDSAYIDDLIISGMGGITYSYVPEGFAVYHIQIENLTQITGNKLFWNSNQPTNTNIEFYISDDAANWQFISNNTQIDWLINSSRRDFYIKVLLQTLDGSISPTVNSINFSAWYEIQSSIKRTQEYIRLYDLRGNLTAILENAYNIVIEEKLGDAETLSFSIPFEDMKAQYIAHDEEVIYNGKRYIVTEIVESRDDSGVETKDVSCELAYIELLGLVKRGDFTVDRKSVTDGLNQILSGSRWTVGTIEADTNKIYSISETNQTVLWLIRQWAKVTGTEVQWDSMNRVVNLLSQVGSNRGAAFRYRKNLKNIKRTVQPPQATVLYPYGAGGLSIATLNNGKEYIEDYSWYTYQGLSLDEARKRFKKEYIWQDDRFILAGNLLDAAYKKLAELSQPIISYECTVLDLSNVTGLSEDKFYLGDNVRVYDSELNIDINTRILRLKRYPHEPWNNEVELSYIIPGLQDTEERSISSEVAAAQPQLILGSNNEPLTLNTMHQYVMQLAITNFASTNAQVGVMIIGQASTQMTITVMLFMGGNQIGPTIQQICQAGWNTIGVPFIIPQLQEGSNFINVQAYTSTGTFTVAANYFQVFIYAANLLGGLSSESPHAEVEEVISNIMYLNLNLEGNVGLQIPILSEVDEDIITPVISDTPVVIILE